MHDLPGVAVFWDIDTCPISPLLSGYDIVAKIRNLTQTLGIVKSFKGYADLSELQVSKAVQLRSELQSSGVSLIDCPATERTSISSKMMMVDLLLHAIDNPPPTTFVVISGNSDFSYAISILRLRRYRVILVCLKDRAGPHSQASMHLDWFHDVIGNEFRISDAPTPPDQRRPGAHSSDSHVQMPSRSAVKSRTTIQNQDTSEPELHTSLSKDTTEPSIDPTFREGSSISGSRRESISDRCTKTSVEQRCAPAQPMPPIPTMEASRGRELGSDPLTDTSMLPDFHDYIQRPSSAPPSYTSFSPAPSPLTHISHQTGTAFVDYDDGGDLSDSETVDTEVERPGRPGQLPQSPTSTSTDTIIPSPASTLVPLSMDLSAPPPSITLLTSIQTLISELRTSKAAPTPITAPTTLDSPPRLAEPFPAPAPSSPASVSPIPTPKISSPASTLVPPSMDLPAPPPTTTLLTSIQTLISELRTSKATPTPITAPAMLDSSLRLAEPFPAPVPSSPASVPTSLVSSIPTPKTPSPASTLVPLSMDLPAPPPAITLLTSIQTLISELRASKATPTPITAPATLDSSPRLAEPFPAPVPSSSASVPTSLVSPIPTPRISSPASTPVPPSMDLSAPPPATTLLTSIQTLISELRTAKAAPTPMTASTTLDSPPRLAEPFPAPVPSSPASVPTSLVSLIPTPKPVLPSTPSAPKPVVPPVPSTPNPALALALATPKITPVPIAGTPKLAPVSMTETPKVVPVPMTGTPKVAPASMAGTPKSATIPITATPKLGSTSRAPESPLIRPPAPEVIPPHFHILVSTLQELRAKGDSKPFRPGIAALIITSNSDDLKAAGATSFTEYVQLAERAGVVELPGKEGGLWVALRPELFQVTVDI